MADPEKPRDGEGAGSPATPSDSDEIRGLRETAARAQEYLDIARRTKADFINYQDRIRRERAEWGRDLLVGFIRDFLPALDAFTWARFEDPALTESLRILDREFLQRLARHDVFPIETVGETFDPMLHEVVSVEETTDKPAGTILGQLRRGWRIGSHVIRPAGVRVAKAPAGDGQKTSAPAAPAPKKENR